MAIVIRNMKRTANGEVLVMVDGGEEKAQKLRKICEERVGNATARLGQRERTLVITDVEPGTRAEEVVAAIVKEQSLTSVTGAGMSGIKVKGMREARNGNLVAWLLWASLLRIKYLKKVKSLSDGLDAESRKERTSKDAIGACVGGRAQSPGLRERRELYPVQGSRSQNGSHQLPKEMPSDVATAKKERDEGRRPLQEFNPGLK